MNTVQVKVPELSESVSEATLLEWKRKPGDIVAADEIPVSYTHLTLPTNSRV